MAARTHYILIDYENVQPADLAMLRNGPFKVRVFLGSQQSKIPVALAASLQELGANAEYVRLTSSGSNAADFHIAYYLGILASQESSAYFHIISKDTGFDPLLQHLKSTGVLAQRSPSIASIPYFTSDAQVDAVVAHLVKLKASRPRTEKAFLGTLQALFKKELPELQITAIIASLRKRGVLTSDGAKVTYLLPPGT